MPTRHHEHAINALVAGKIDDFGESLLRYLDDESVREPALCGLAVYRLDHAGQEIIERYVDWPSDHQQIALTILASRAAWASQLLTAMDENRIPAKT